MHLPNFNHIREYLGKEKKITYKAGAENSTLVASQLTQGHRAQAKSHLQPFIYIL
jgi:hypothetical protein